MHIGYMQYVSFCLRDLSTHSFGICEVMEPIAHGYRGTTPGGISLQTVQ